MASKFEDFLDELDQLPADIKRSLTLMRQLDLKKDGKYDCHHTVELSTENVKAAKAYFSLVKKKGQLSVQYQEQKRITLLIRANAEKIHQLSKEKIELAKKCYNCVEGNLKELNSKVVKMEDKMRKQGAQPSAGKLDKSKTISKKYDGYVLY